VSAGHNGDGLLMAPATGQVLATWITTSRQPQEVASFGLSRFDQPS
jgi:glycine/D-amino acid oxidase-like deaminating enzyme